MILCPNHSTNELADETLHMHYHLVPAYCVGVAQEAFWQVIWTWISCHHKGSVIFSVSLHWNAAVLILSRYPLTTEPETPRNTG